MCFTVLMQPGHVNLRLQCVVAALCGCQARLTAEVGAACVTYGLRSIGVLPLLAVGQHLQAVVTQLFALAGSWYTQIWLLTKECFTILKVPCGH
jgi:hypothetical protein